jgi:hypothetical protein
MPTDFGERRRVSRCIPVPTSALSRVRLRAGRELAVVNLSTFGTLIEGTTRLLPGTHVDVHVTAAQGRTLVRARVVRCAVCKVTADVIEYRGALAFCIPVDLPAMELTQLAEERYDPLSALQGRLGQGQVHRGGEDAS